MSDAGNDPDLEDNSRARIEDRWDKQEIPRRNFKTPNQGDMSDAGDEADREDISRAREKDCTESQPEGSPVQGVSDRGKTDRTCIMQRSQLGLFRRKRRQTGHLIGKAGQEGNFIQK